MPPVAHPYGHDPPRHLDQPVPIDAAVPEDVVSVAVTIAVGVNGDGRREVLGMAVGPSEAETFWTDFLRGLARRGLRGVRLVISDAHEGLKAAFSKILRATWQRCRAHFMRNATAHAGKTQRRIVSAWIGSAFAEADAPAAHAQWRIVADQLRPKMPRLAALMDVAEHDVLAYAECRREPALCVAGLDSRTLHLVRNPGAPCLLGDSCQPASSRH